jgi:methionyl-tRNA synthetase
MSEKRKILATAALPYVNGDIHLGHLVEYSMVDFWCRFQKLRGHDCAYICADDTHGSPVMISARKQGVTPEQLIEGYAANHKRDFAAFEIEFDNYSSTHTETNRQFAYEFFHKLQAAGKLQKKEQTQLYCEQDKMFLPDRFVTGTCPKCKAEGQYGDNCEVCNATYSPVELVGAKCTICGSTPTARQTEHLFFNLNSFKDFLQQWTPEHSPKEVYNKLKEWLSADLQDWCISRDAPYFGFEIPGYPGKYLYVWVDAPIGYISSSKEWCDKTGHSFDEYWKSENTEVYHFIGKDIVYFHTLFWPAMLKTVGYRLPNQVFVHGMLTVNGAKMSKSRGTFVNAATYLDYLNPLYYRYYLACKLTSSIDDLDLNLDDFVSRVNSDLVGKITNVASRGASMIHKLDGKLGTIPTAGAELIRAAQERSETIASYYENREFGKAILEIRAIADDANKYFDSYEPWKLVKVDPEKTKQVLTTILNLFRIMTIYLKPILPSYAQKVEELFKEERPYGWSDLFTIAEQREIAPFTHLIKRIEVGDVEKMIEKTKENAEKAQQATQQPAAGKKDEGAAGTISIDDFAKIDLRVAKILEAQDVEGAQKLVRLTLDIGTETRQVFAGIKSAYKPEDLVGRLVVMVANLAPRKMKFGMSEGMVLAAGEGGTDIFLIAPDSGAKPGDQVG